MPIVNVHFLPRLVEPKRLAGSTCVVIDVLRATTTIAHALEAGAAAVSPCLEVSDALQLASTLSPGTFLLGGERGGRLIEGFDVGNSPAEYTAVRVANKTIVFTTTNGTRAMHHCHQAAEILIGAFVNAQAISDVLVSRDKVDIVCAGTDGEITREDVLAAGVMVSILRDAPGERAFNDEALIAADAWHAIESSAPSAAATGRLYQHLADSRGGRNLIALGMQADIAIAAELSTRSVMPVYRDGRITRLSSPA